MKVTFPHMGTTYIMLKALFQSLGIEVVVPPSTSKETLTLGVRHCPEFACLPLKVNVGNYIEAFHQGADTVVMAGGNGPCRFGYYAQVQREILDDLGYNLKFIILDPFDGDWRNFLVDVKALEIRKSWQEIAKAIKFAWEKIYATDELERWTNKIRARELETGRTTIVSRQALKWVDEAQNIKEVREALHRGINTLKSVPHHENNVLKVGLVGEIFVILEPFVNMEIERRLGEMGVEVVRSIYLSDWIRDHLFFNAFHFFHRYGVKMAAKPYLKHHVGGHGLETIGNAVLYAQQAFDGVVQVLPFTCMPEIVAQSLLPKVSRELHIPVLTLIVDEHTGEAGLVTRLEAFIELMRKKHERREVNAK